MEANFTISKFWTRIWALVIDSLVLGIVGIVLGLIIEDFLVRIGSYGFLLGMAIAIAYFAVFNSKYKNGQTYGKKAMDIQVVDKEGNTLSFSKSLLRAFIICFPYFFINVELPGVSIGSALFLLKNITCISITTGILIIYIFNKGNRQSLHDLLVGTFVVSTERAEIPSKIQPFSKSSFYAFGAILVMLTLFTIYSLTFVYAQYSKLNTIHAGISEIKGVMKAGVMDKTSTVYGAETATLKIIEVTLWMNELPENSDGIENMKETKEVLKIVLGEIKDIRQFDRISIVLVRGFNIGIASKKTSFSTQKSPSEWKAFL